MFYHGFLIHLFITITVFQKVTYVAPKIQRVFSKGEIFNEISG